VESRDIGLTAPFGRPNLDRVTLLRLHAARPIPDEQPVIRTRLRIGETRRDCCPASRAKAIQMSHRRLPNAGSVLADALSKLPILICQYLSSSIAPEHRRRPRSGGGRNGLVEYDNITPGSILS